MRLGTPFDTLHDALAAAAYHDMPEKTYEDRDNFMKDIASRSMTDVRGSAKYR